MLPMGLWKLIFLLGLPLALYKAIIDPIWAAMAAAYTYFAIPTLEFNAPEGIPYQAMFWALAVFGSLRYRQLLRDSAREDILLAGVEAGRHAIDAARAQLQQTLVERTLESTGLGDVRAAALAAAEGPAFEAADEKAPRDILLAVRRGVKATLDGAAELGEREGLKLVDNVGAATKGTLRSALELRVSPLVDQYLDTHLEEALRREVERTMETFDTARDRVESQGPLDIPMPRGPLAGVLTNAGLWGHILFTVITYFLAQEAEFSVYKAMTKYDTCTLLFIPMVAIMCAVRDARHVKLFVYAWILGTFHITMNGVTWWWQNGGRADNAGGQGGESNFLGGIIVTIAPVAYGMILNEKSWKGRGTGVFLAAMFVLGILASGSRAALISLIVGGGYWLLHTNRKGFATGGAMIATACFLVAAPEDFWERMSTIMGPKDKNPWVEAKVEESKHERQVLWALAIDVWKEHPWWGIGPGQYNYVSAERTSFVDAYQGNRGLQTHNTWLQLAAEYGTIGTAVWGGTFLMSLLAYRFGRRRLRPYREWDWFSAMLLGLEAGAVSNAVTCAFNSFQWYDYHYWHFVFGPVAYQVAKETALRAEWMRPIEAKTTLPPPRYGPPSALGLDLKAIDVSDLQPVRRAEPGRAEPGRAEPGRAEPGRAEPAT